MTAAINSTGAGKRGYPTKSSVPSPPASTQRRARERSVAIQTLLLVRKSKSSSVKSKTVEALMSLIEAKAVWKRTDCSVTGLMISYLLVVEQHRTQIVIHALVKWQQENLYHEQNVTHI